MYNCCHFVRELAACERGVSIVLFQRIPPCCTSYIQTVLAVRKQIHSSEVLFEQKQTKETSRNQPFALLWCASYVRFCAATSPRPEPNEFSPNFTDK